MLKFTLIKAIFAVALTMITILSCNKESPIVDPIKNENGSGLTEEQIEKNRNIFSQVLARSLKNENVRILLKKASLKRINKDTDVLFHLVKDEIIEKILVFMNT
ncbi:hypothetical protein BWI96_10915 [Siphonobacter sp. SORGH_AS_0500]|uniref:hypothetical protein n=1 Tax=Siphonobacter sp. SORGH_AS_0500 TaxID=1864824 RepID=UPI000CB52095|nr:hypothetical protein [Siphonobacter sp. SORGH_AS_0500]PKK36372.1 hypothetical protein BWI96_10915 [Siphonobacter sp. SORGH_AS_0500]